MDYTASRYAPSDALKKKKEDEEARARRQLEEMDAEFLASKGILPEPAASKPDDVLLHPEEFGPDVKLASRKTASTPSATQKNPKNDVKEYLMNKYASQAMSDREILDAQKGQSEDAFNNNLGRAFNTISSSIAGVKNDSSFYDTLDKQSGDEKKTVQDYILNKYKIQKDDQDRQLEMKKLDRSLADSAETRRHHQEMEKLYGKKDGEKRAALSQGQLTDITSYDKALAAIDNVMAQKPKWDTGRLSFGLNKAAEMVGLDDPEKSAFKSDVGEQLAQYIKSISGATVSPTERAALLANVPKVTDNDETFTAKATALRKRVEGIRSIELANLKKAGKDISEFETASRNTSSGGKVKVSNGSESYLIDPADLADAEKDGFKRVQ